MAFFFVVLGVMAVSAHLIYRIAKHFGWQLEYRSLLLCAAMAPVVTAGVILMSPYLTKDVYVRLGVLIFAAAAAVTAYDGYLGRQRAVLALPQSEGVPVYKAKRGSGKGEEGSGAVRDASSEAVLEETPSQETVSEKPAPERTVGQGADAERQEELPSKLAELFAGMESLDDILDYAYEQRFGGDPGAAALALREALKRYGGDEYAPFIVIELGDLYKEQADYAAAIRVYKRAFDLPVIGRNDEIGRKFTGNLVYLQTVQSVLSKHDALALPFQDIPKEYLEEIEAAYQQHDTGKPC